MTKTNLRVNKRTWLLPLAFALPVLCAGALALILWGDTIRDIISIAVKVAVIS